MMFYTRERKSFPDTLAFAGIYSMPPLGTGDKFGKSQLL